MDGVDNRVQAAYTWGADGLVSEHLMASGYYGSNPEKSLWYGFGPQGETRQLTDSTGVVADTYSYTAYGRQVSSSGSDANAFRYGGQWGYYTGPSGASTLILCGLRWYDPAMGRFISRDPIGYDGGENLYTYGRNNPIINIDPSGLYPGTDDWGRTIMDRWGHGKGKHLSIYGGDRCKAAAESSPTGPTMGQYMMANEGLTQDVAGYLADLSYEVPRGKRKSFIRKFAAVMTPGTDGKPWDTTGYTLLHGTDSLYITGFITHHLNGGYTYNMSYRWHDRIDPNKKYDTNWVVGLGNWLQGGHAQDYTIDVSWSATCTNRRNKHMGWPFGN